MKKIIPVLCAITACTAIAYATAATAFAPKTVRAENTEMLADSLILPDSYEEYLPLRTPSDIAVCEDYTAIADGNLIYLFDRARNAYTTYVHTPNTEDSKNKVTKLQFDSNDDLYFLDATTYLYKIEESAFDRLDESEILTETGIPCSAFLIHGEYLYYTTVTSEAQLSKVALDKLNIHDATTLENGIRSKPALAFANGELYFTDAGKYLRKLDPESTASMKSTLVADFQSDIASMTIAGGTFACTDTDGNFAVYGLHEIAPISPTPVFRDTRNYTALTAFGEKIYAVDGNTVKEYDAQNQRFTDYEIASSSTSAHRLNQAVATLLQGNLLFIGDIGNSRISVYDTTQKTILPAVNATLPPCFLASDGKTLLVANAESAVLYSLQTENYGAELASFQAFNGNLVGVAGRYGDYYLASDSNYYYALSKQDNEWILTETKKTSTRYPQSLTSDARGNLYTVSGNDVFRFTPTQLITEKETGEEICSVPDGTTKIAVDYERNVYALAHNAIYRIVDNAVFDYSAPLPYADGVSVTDFTFGIEENATYLLCDSNYVICSTRLRLPTVKTIPVNGADELVFAQAEAEFVVVETQENALFIAFDLPALQGAEFFPYSYYDRMETPRTALQISRTDDYAILAVFETAENAYRVYLVANDEINELPADEYRVDYPESEQTTGYLTNAVGLYKFPYLNELLLAGELPRGAQVTVLGEITNLDHDYYRVAYQDESGATHTGFIPKPYANHFDGTIKPSETTHHGASDSNRDSVWRFAYLILGFGAICILTDYLILKKRNDEPFDSDADGE